MTDESVRNVTCSGDCASCGQEPDSCGEGGGATIDVALDDGVVTCAVIAIYEAAGRQYMALLPLDEKGENHDGLVWLYRCVTTPDGKHLTDNIATDEEYETASAAFDRWVDEHTLDGIVYEEAEEEA